MASTAEPLSSSIKLTTRNDLSTLYRLTRAVLKPIKPRLVQLGKPLPAGSPKLDPPNLRCTIRERRVEDIYLYDFGPSTNNNSATKSRTISNHIFYFCGGGYQSLPTKDHWKLCDELYRLLSDLYKVTLVSYPLAPNSPAPESLPLLEKFLQATRADAKEQGNKITLMGDSAGGNVALSLAFWLASLEHDSSKDLCPVSNVMVISPGTDLRDQNPKMDEVNRYDPVLTKDLSRRIHEEWAGSWGTDNARVSSNLGDFSQLKASKIKIHGILGTHDILSPDAIVFRELCAKNGIEGEWLQWEGQMHCFPLTFRYGIPEGKQGKDWIVDVLRRHA